MKARNIGSWARSSFLAMAAVMLCLAAAYPEEPGGIESLLDRYPRGWGSKQRQAAAEVVSEFLRMPRETETYLNGLFSPKTDDLYDEAKRDALEPERAAQLTKHRRLVLSLVGEIDGWGKGTVQQALLLVPPEKRPEAARFLDHVCQEVRPKLFRRALGVADDSMQELVLKEMRSVGDLRLMDAVFPLPELRGTDRCTYSVSLLRYAAGQQALMRKILDARLNNSGITETAYDYAIRAGDEPYATTAAINCLKENPRGAKAMCAAYGLAILSTPEARRYALELAEAKTTSIDVRLALYHRWPAFFPDERVPFYLRFQQSKESRGGSPGVLLKWLMTHNSDAGLGLARAVVAKRRKPWEGWLADVYLAVFGDASALKRMTESANSPDPEVHGRGITRLIWAGKWDRLPDGLEGKVHGATDSYRQGWLTQAERHRDARSLDLVRMLARDEPLTLRAWTLCLDLGDRSVIPALKKLLPSHCARPRAPAAAALYRAGDESMIDDLTDIARSQGFHGPARVAATQALGSGPDATKPRAARALLGLLLDPDGRVSEAARQALCKLSGREDVQFEPWADDATRQRQAKVWAAWVGSLK